MEPQVPRIVLRKIQNTGVMTRRSKPTLVGQQQYDSRKANRSASVFGLYKPQQGQRIARQLATVDMNTVTFDQISDAVGQG